MRHPSLLERERETEKERERKKTSPGLCKDLQQEKKKNPFVLENLPQFNSVYFISIIVL